MAIEPGLFGKQAEDVGKHPAEATTQPPVALSRSIRSWSVLANAPLKNRLGRTGMTRKKRVLFLCVGNSCRSQMAEGLLRHMAPEKFDVHSAGSMASGLSSTAVRVMAELGIDISGHRSKRVDEFSDQTFDYVVTVCDETEDKPCPVFLGQAGKQFHWPFDDPACATGNDQQILAVFRRIRDQIRDRLERFVMETNTG